MGHGTIITESTITAFMEDGTQRYEPLYKETDGGKYDIANYEKIDKDGKKTPKSTDISFTSLNVSIFNLIVS